MDRPLYDTCSRSKLKRTFSVMQRGQSPSTLSTTSPPRPRPSSRFPSDGLDLRQPIMPTSQPIVSTNFVDLTGSDVDESEASSSTTRSTRHPRTRFQDQPSTSTRPAQRLPRYPNPIFGDEEVIDLEEILDPIPTNASGAGSRRHPSLPPSPEVQFLHARPRIAPLPPLPPLRPPQQQQQAAEWQATGPDFVEIGTRSGYQPVNAMLRILAARPAIGPSPTAGTLTALHVYRRIADRINYRQVGFPLATLDTVQETPASATPAIEPLPPAKQGFTRSPKEEDELICPSCGDELSVGNDEVKRQVWVVKTCGHVYCGGCAKKENRSPPKRRSGKAQAKSTDPRPFLKCVVEGCGKPVTGPKAMIQLFL